MCTGPLSGYPSANQLSQLQLDQWYKLGVHFRLTNVQLEEMKKSSNPTAAVLLAAKVKDINLKWIQLLEAFLRVGEYKLAESICNEQGKLHVLSSA